MSGTLTDTTARRVLEAQLLEQAFHDELTGLANRALFKDRLEHALSRRSTGRRLVGLLYLDVDRFKTVNDSLGHTAGDSLLLAIADRLRSVLRPEDTIARLGGDEFGILVEEIHLPDEALAVAERVLSAFEEPFELLGRQMTVRASVGVVVAVAGDRTGDDLLRDADVAMYRAKVGGRGSYALFEPSMQAEVAARMELEADLRHAVEERAADSPTSRSCRSRIIGSSASRPWPAGTTRREAMCPRCVFIPCAEESGLIVALGRWVLRQACEDVAASAVRAGQPPALRLSVNVSPAPAE